MSGPAISTESGGTMQDMREVVYDPWSTSSVSKAAYWATRSAGQLVIGYA